MEAHQIQLPNVNPSAQKKFVLELPSQPERQPEMRFPLIVILLILIAISSSKKIFSSRKLL